MRKWCIGIICLVVISSEAFLHKTSRGFQGGHQSQGGKGGAWVNIDANPVVWKMVQQGLRMMNYDPRSIKLKTVKQKADGQRGLIFRVGFTNPMWRHSCVFQVSQCFSCIAGIQPIRPSCSSPCPGNACRVDKKLRHFKQYLRTHEKNWSDRQYHERDTESRMTNNQADGTQNGGFGFYG